MGRNRGLRVVVPRKRLICGTERKVAKSHKNRFLVTTWSCLPKEQYLTSAVGNESDDSGSGFGLPSGGDSPPCFCESKTCSAICRPILLASMCVLIIRCISLPFA